MLALYTRAPSLHQQHLRMQCWLYTLKHRSTVSRPAANAGVTLALYTSAPSLHPQQLLVLRWLYTREHRLYIHSKCGCNAGSIHQSTVSTPTVIVGVAPEHRLYTRNNCGWSSASVHQSIVSIPATVVGEALPLYIRASSLYPQQLRCSSISRKYGEALLYKLYAELKIWSVR